MDTTTMLTLAVTFVTALLAAVAALAGTGAYSMRGRDRRSIEGEARILANLTEPSDAREELRRHIDARVMRHLDKYFWSKGKK